ncbi:hypothetical protein BC834DRAFT_238500 [Gloeopeniophorella convolvens]|nr:hypothetical protein BC834DRAFT_238500 [Gloeopeniophorella convolvens]
MNLNRSVQLTLLREPSRSSGAYIADSTGLRGRPKSISLKSCSATNIYLPINLDTVNRGRSHADLFTEEAVGVCTVHGCHPQCRKGKASRCRFEISPRRPSTRMMTPRVAHSTTTETLTCTRQASGTNPRLFGSPPVPQVASRQLAQARDKNAQS